MGTTGCSGVVTLNNSVLGTTANRGAYLTFAYDSFNHQLVVGRPYDNRVTLFKMDNPGPFRYTYLPLLKR